VTTTGDPAVVVTTAEAGGSDGDMVVGGGEDMIAAELADTKSVELTALPAIGRSL
jgi:hypothetical protein